MGRRRAEGRRHERGAALIEAAFVTPVFFLLLFGIFEFGLLFRNSLTTNNAAQQGARAASVGGRAPDTDYLVLRSIEHGVSAMGLQELEVVVVFRAQSPDDAVPPACLTNSVAATSPTSVACNRYTASDFFLEIEDPATGVATGNWQCGASAVDRFWCPSGRATSLSTGTDYLGVYVETDHSFITGLFGGGRQLSETRIVRLEPDAN
ncbi:MAG: TadE/TadG family type IV pilus assembly protein [Acidimicrobiales bacterium]